MKELKLHTQTSINSIKDIRLALKHYYKGTQGASNIEIENLINNVYKKPLETGLFDIEVSIVKSGNQIVSVALLMDYTSLDFHILGILYTVPKFRNQGIGSDLVKSYIKKAKAENKPFFIALDQDEVSETMPFYEQFGIDKILVGLLPSNLVIGTQKDIDFICSTFGVSQAA
ncbi:GNAT family N-acetyltransferase [Vibrio sp. 1CM23M]|uniref:GNAT family N-acetyltransferase n=1 Tax=Vibrio sp. 1CM23M TaxID=2929164 RepID=UPI0020BF8172|nr:GNAT family N-acetyltransferase [Vibrio sp. 1CM23M]MCK8072467.1 GNAT family N-acetyltransferase [Vibrio sp. 1CM23M]